MFFIRAVLWVASCIAFDLKLVDLDRGRLCGEVYLEQRTKKVAFCGFGRIPWFGARSYKIGDRYTRKLQERLGKALGVVKVRLRRATTLVFIWHESAGIIRIRVECFTRDCGIFYKGS